MAALSGTINDNPFADVCGDFSPRAAPSLKDNNRGLLSSSSSNARQKHNHDNEITSMPRGTPTPRDCGMTMLQVLVRIGWFVDGLIGLLLMFYGAWLLENKWHSQQLQPQQDFVVTKNITIAVFSMGSLLLARCFTGFLIVLVSPSPPSSDTLSSWRSCCQRCGLWLSVNLSPMVALACLILAVTNWTCRKTVLEWLLGQPGQNQHPFPRWCARVVVPLLVHQQHHLSRCISLTFLVLALWEGLRWYLLQRYRRRLLSVGAHDESDDNDNEAQVLLPVPSVPPVSRRRPRRRGRPWWWSSNTAEQDALNESLLSTSSTGVPRWVSNRQDGYYDNETGAASPDHDNSRRRRRPDRSWFWFWGNGGQDDNNNNPRDDGSVDFVSVQEEWASRTEEDPFWWSRDEDKNEEDIRSFSSPSWISTTQVGPDTSTLQD
jgi:hypothetical protein